MPNVLHVFDFDQTLVNTPDVEDGKLQWLRLHGSPWPHAGWWGRPESLDARLTSTPGPALGAYRDAVTDTTAVVVLLTGRRAHMAAGVALHAARHGVCESLLFTWRRQVRDGVLVAAEMPVFMPVQMLGTPLATPGLSRPEPTSPALPSAPARSQAGLIEIELGDGRQVRVGADVNQAALRRVLAALRG